MAEMARRLKEQATNKDTRPAGVKDLGSKGDVVWTDGDGEYVESMRGLGTVISQVDADLSNLNNVILPSIKDATYIDDNMITTRLIAANSIGADQIIANSITGDKIAAKSIAAEKILGGSFAGQEFEGGEFTGGVFRTSRGTQGGAIKIDQTNGIQGWNEKGTRTFVLSPGDGSVAVSADLRATNSSNQGFILRPQTGSGNAAMFFTDDGSTSGDQPAIWRNSYTNAREPLRLRGARKSGVWINDYLRVDGNADIKGGAFGGLNANGGNFNVSVVPAGSFTAQGPTYLTDARDLTTGGAANVRMNEDSGRIARTTSSRRYKRDIEDWTPDTGTILALRPRSWAPKNPEEEGIEATADGRYVGFIAEEVDDLGLTGLVSYSRDDDGQQRPESLNYDRFCAAQQVVLRDHEARLVAAEQRADALQAENEALRSELHALTARVDALTA
jgi:hypothetical protein